uniref:Uncharacterized protein n=1 Tax=Chromera velia CCMP2878 TaxID=1169474 RepID=A0A0G4H1I5_9ALVE|eukprot:Cvel_24307.t1-p1 / transcript=Cvel_24307.t1 / gene=Cvel_24307 / organism=Chromera_velia_CCMP2878 / gene_product=hypothetical protein / transcript_product=hypothetical protein / location=Cvel_scaffold2611:8327-9196(-) / protein_length=290 / sequence_SO=supercontig / SO=protein_coding / is_pseudo=false
MKRISEIDLTNSFLSTEGVAALANAVRRGVLDGLERLDVRGNRLDLQGNTWGKFIKAIIEREGGLPKLRKLSVDELAVHGLLVIALGSGKLPSLERLHPSELFFGHVRLKSVARAVRTGRFPLRLRTLKFGLRRNVEVDCLVRAIAGSQKGLPLCVSSLNLSGGRVGEDALRFLAEGGSGGSGKLSHLVSLDLSQCEIDDKKLKILGEVFCTHRCPQLRFLNLEENSFSSAGVSVFFDNLRPDSLPKLKRVKQGVRRGLECGIEGRVLWEAVGLGLPPGAGTWRSSAGWI